MKRLTVVLGLIMLVKLVTGQDFIIKKNGDEVKAKVSEVTSTEIKFSKIENPGVTYSISKSEVFMIKYANGAKDLFNEKSEPIQESTDVKKVDKDNSSSQISNGEELTYSGGRVMKERRKLKPYEVKNMMVSNSKALGQYKGGRFFKTLGWISTGLCIVDTGIGLANSANGYDASGTFVIAAVEGGLGVIFQLVSSSKFQKSVNIFNAGLNKQTSYKLNLGLTPDGVGLCLKF
jgi:hypothetical protein